MYLIKSLMSDIVSFSDHCRPWGDSRETKHDIVGICLEGAIYDRVRLLYFNHLKELASSCYLLSRGKPNHQAELPIALNIQALGIGLEYL